MGVALKDPQIKATNKKRRKKRRTEDFSSDSSSSSSDSETEPKIDISEQITTMEQDQGQNVSLNGIEFDSASSSQARQQIIDETKLKISHIKITNHPNITSTNKEEMAKIARDLDEEEQDLRNQFLVKMMQEYDSDLDELRKQPDFTGKSLPLLAKILKNGGNIFDDETLKTVLRD